MNKYHQILQKVLTHGKYQTNKKGSIRYLLNEQLVLSPADLLAMWRSIARWASTGGTTAVPFS